MYSPSHYRESREELVEDAVRRFSFATLITLEKSEPFASHLPLLFEPESRTLLGHCARANPQWRHLAEGQVVTSIFSGPHAYISPAWYSPADDNVPTWNYVAVHIKGRATIIENPTEVYAALQKIVRHFETTYETGWDLPAAANTDLSGLMKGIVAFRIQIEHIDAKFKLSQKEDASNREAVIARLSSRNNDQARGLAEYMRQTRSKQILVD